MVSILIRGSVVIFKSALLVLSIGCLWKMMLCECVVSVCVLKEAATSVVVCGVFFAVLWGWLLVFTHILPF